MKRIQKILALILALSVICFLVACNSNQQNEEEENQEGGTDDSKLRIALLLPGSLNDGGWNAAAYTGLMQLKDEGYDVAFTENVTIAGIEEAMRNYAYEEYDLIIGHGFEFGEPAMRVAPEFPDVNFFVSGKMPDGVTEEDLVHGLPRV